MKKTCKWSWSVLCSPPLTLSSWRRPSHWVLHSCWTSGCRVSLTQEELPGFLSTSHLWLVIRNIRSHLVTSSFSLHYYSLDISFTVHETLEVKLTRATQDRLFDHVAARHHLLEAFGPLLQEPLSCHHLQLPANTTSTYYWTHHAASSVLKMKNLTQLLDIIKTFLLMTGFLQGFKLNLRPSQTVLISHTRRFITCITVITATVER